MNDVEMFPPTPEERLADVRTHLADELEKRDKAATAAMQKLYEARQLLETFDEAMRSRAGGDVLAAACDMRRHAEEAGIGVSIKVGDAEPVVIAKQADVDPARLAAAIALATATGAASVSLLQRRMSIGYAQAAQLIDEMEKAGVIEKTDGSRAWRVVASEATTPATFTDEVAAELDERGVEYVRGEGPG